MSCVHSAIYWTETNSRGQSNLLKCSLDGSDVQHVLGSATRHRRHEACNCPDLTPSREFVVDHTRKGDTEIFVSDDTTGTIWAVDIQGCQCRQVVNARHQSPTHKMGNYNITCTIDLMTSNIVVTRE